MKTTTSRRIVGLAFIAVLGALTAGCEASQPFGSINSSQQTATLPEAGCPQGQNSVNCHEPPGTPGPGPAAPVPVGY